MAFLHLSRDRAAALGAQEPSGEREVMFAPSARLASAAHHLLHLVEQCLAHQRREGTGKELAVDLHHAVIHGIREHALDTGNGKFLAASGTQAKFRQFVTEAFERVAPGRIGKYPKLKTHC
ncbi:MAG: hypothetical protein V1876_02300 [Candidatus Peregrinibacteria bacterium]